MSTSKDIRYLPFNIRLEALNLFYCRNTVYEPEIFQGLLFTMKRPQMTFVILPNGKIIAMEYDRFDNEILEKAFTKLLSILNDFKCS